MKKKMSRAFLRIFLALSYFGKNINYDLTKEYQRCKLKIIVILKGKKR